MLKQELKRSVHGLRVDQVVVVEDQQHFVLAGLGGQRGVRRQPRRHFGARAGRERFPWHVHLRVTPTATPARTVFAEPVTDTTRLPLTGRPQSTYVRNPDPEVRDVSTPAPVPSS